MKNLVIKSTMLVGFFLLVGTAAQADHRPDHKPGTGVPIDGGASALLAAGAAYGLKKLKQRRSAKA